jgi:hypothetical protein
LPITELGNLSDEFFDTKKKANKAWIKRKRK